MRGGGVRRSSRVTIRAPRARVRVVKNPKAGKEGPKRGMFFSLFFLETRPMGFRICDPIMLSVRVLYLHSNTTRSVLSSIVNLLLTSVFLNLVADDCNVFLE